MYHDKHLFNFQFYYNSSSKNFQATLVFLLDHLAMVVGASGRNKMCSGSVASCLAPVLILHSESATDPMDFMQPISVLRYLLDIWPNKSGNVSFSILCLPPATVASDLCIIFISLLCSVFLESLKNFGKYVDEHKSS